MSKVRFSVFLILSIVILALQVATLLTPTWVKYNNETYDLFKCVSCKDLKKSWTFECLARQSCKNQDESCQDFNDLFNSGKTFAFFQIFSIFCGIIVLEKLFLLVSSKSIGNLMFFYLFCLLHFAFAVASLVAWFSMSSAKYSNTLSGPKLAITTIIVIFISYLSMIIPIRGSYQGCVVYVETQYQPICKISSKVLLAIGLAFGALSLCLIYIGVINENWVSWNSVEGSLFKCKNCLEFKDSNWVCSQTYFCEIDENSEQCEVYRKVSESSSTFIPLQLLSIFFITLSFQPGAASLLSTHYGWKYISQTYIGLALIFNLSGTLSFALLSEIKVKGSCGDKLCPDSGFYLIVISNIFIAAYWVIDFVSRTRFKVVQYYVSQKSVASTERRDSGLQDFAVDDKGGVRSLAIIGNLENVGNGDQGDEDWSRRNSASHLLKFNTMNPEFLSSNPEFLSSNPDI